MLTDSFLLELKKKYQDAFSGIDPGATLQTRKWDFANRAGSVEVNVLRGSVFEKACVSTIAATVTIPDRDYKSSIQWLGVQTFPSQPDVPMLMAVFEHVDETGLEHYPGFFDVYPVIPFEEDKKQLADIIGGVCRSYKRPYPDLPASYLKMFRLQEAGIGVGYGTGMSLMPDETDHGFFKQVAEAVLSSYFVLVKKRSEGSSCTGDQGAVETMNRFRSEWVRFTFMDNRFFQGGVQLGVPVESFMLHMLPPSVRF